jgi:hypothetical protein
MEIQNMCIAWYRPEDYKVLRLLFKDGHKLPLTYEDWEQQVHAICDQLTSQGVIVTKAHIDPKTFPSWCRARDLNIDAKARERFVTEFSNTQQRAN